MEPSLMFKKNGKAMKAFIKVVLVTMILLSITACSSSQIVLPPQPGFTGNCAKDLDDLLRWYVVPIEKQRR